MREVDVAIVGGGLAGSTAAAMLGQAGISGALIDPHPVYPPDFRCEKLDGSQVALLQRTGLADAVFAAASLDDEISVVRYGRLLERRPARQYGILYDALVNTLRARIPPTIPLLQAKVTAIAPSAHRQRVTLSTGEEISARLVILANGLNIGLRHSLGIEREIVSACHSISIGFDVAPADRPRFGFKALTYFPYDPRGRAAYCAFFPIPGTMRANVFVYRGMDDPWLRQMRKAPAETLAASFPALPRLAGRFAVTSEVKIRPVDLYVTTGHRQAGIVLAGDAFATSCPAAGTGANKVFTDVERLCNVHIPRWLASEGMGADKIAQFYDDPVKTACDAASSRKAFFLRALSTESGPAWKLRRAGRFLGRLGMGVLRRAFSVQAAAGFQPPAAAPPRPLASGFGHGVGGAARDHSA
jgi:2-polyprenyl-6-methoxyphenol hydroxylase-like FAD-dependent oxidoreductase